MYYNGWTVWYINESVMDNSKKNDEFTEMVLRRQRASSNFQGPNQNPREPSYQKMSQIGQKMSELEQKMRHGAWPALI